MSFLGGQYYLLYIISDNIVSYTAFLTILPHVQDFRQYCLIYSISDNIVSETTFLTILYHVQHFWQYCLMYNIFLRSLWTIWVTYHCTKHPCSQGGRYQWIFCASQRNSSFTKEKLLNLRGILRNYAWILVKTWFLILEMLFSKNSAKTPQCRHFHYFCGTFGTLSLEH